HPFAVRLTNDRPMMSPVDGEVLPGHSSAGLVRYGDRTRLDRAFFGAVLVGEAVVLFHDGFKILVDVVHAARCMHPACALVESLVDEELAPRERAVGVQALVADH